MCMCMHVAIGISLVSLLNNRECVEDVIYMQCALFLKFTCTHYIRKEDWVQMTVQRRTWSKCSLMMTKNSEIFILV